ncbi:hypothetical protein B0H12DRAFT_1129616 [Mycena haematopus]|nr:hypothetical protein B0H12DRAFT_1129616 [Mycena haematopus]
MAKASRFNMRIQRDDSMRNTRKCYGRRGVLTGPRADETRGRHCERARHGERCMAVAIAIRVRV